MSRFLVTGALGCLGAWVLRELVADGHEPVAFDISDEPVRPRALMSDIDIARITWVCGDITDTDAVKDVIVDQAITHVIHLAALQIPFCRADPVLGARVNIVGTANVFEAAAATDGRVERIAFASSAAVYGPPAAYGDGPAPVTGPLLPDTHYGVFKASNEGMARVYAAERGVASIGLRPYVVYGVGRDQGATAGPTKAMVAALLGRSYTLTFSGSCQLQLARDAARMFIASAVADTRGAQVFNCPGPVPDMQDLVTIIDRIVPGAADRLRVDGPSLPFPSELDDGGFGRLITGIPTTDLEEGVEMTIAGFRTAIDAGRLDASRYLA